MNIATNTTAPNTSAWELAPTAPELTANGRRSDCRMAAADRAPQAALGRKGLVQGRGRPPHRHGDGTFSQWFSGKYGGRLDTTNAQVAKFIDQQDEQASSLPPSGLPALFPDAHKPRGHGGARLGTCRERFRHHHARPRHGQVAVLQGIQGPPPNVWMTTVSEYTKTVNAMLVEIVRDPRHS